MEALIAAHYTLAEWDRECLANKERVIGHYLVKSRREAYESHMAREKGKKGDGKDGGDQQQGADLFQYRKALQEARARKAAGDA